MTAERVALEPCPFCDDPMVVREHSAFHSRGMGAGGCLLADYELDESDYTAWNTHALRQATRPSWVEGDERAMFEKWADGAIGVPRPKGSIRDVLAEISWAAWHSRALTPPADETVVDKVGWAIFVANGHGKDPDDWLYKDEARNRCKHLAKAAITSMRGG